MDIKFYKEMRDIMKAITMSDAAYTEFKQFLDDNKVENYNIRVNLAGIG